MFKLVKLVIFFTKFIISFFGKKWLTQCNKIVTWQ